MKNKSSIPFVMTIFLQVVIMYILLLVLFFVIISKSEEQSFQQSFKQMIKKGFNDIPEDVKEGINLIPIEVLDALQKLYGKPDPVVTKNNSWLTYTSVIFAGAFVVSYISTALILKYVCCEDCDWSFIFMETGFVFLFIGAIEYIFFMEIASKYVPEMPSEIYEDLISAFDNILN